MDNSRTKLVGPAIAVGAISLGLIVIGSCGLGQHDTYVPPPPLKAGPYVTPAAHQEPVTSSAVPSVVIPPSPTWRVAPNVPRPSTPFTGFGSAAPSGSADDSPPPEPQSSAETTRETTTGRTTTRTYTRTTTPRSTTDLFPTHDYEPPTNPYDNDVNPYDSVPTTATPPEDNGFDDE
ncbi:hypothetical protein [Nocardia callitridis]|uniref:Lipoprotein n=1 Tax=Nocardia callitridis TaxID=648753 RepID=A0ABP9JQS2_9NOCA